jgi:O-antigen/teichoic acid export membrane protein
MLLGVTQQVALIPVFLHFWTSDVLAAWLTIYATGNLILIADCGLHVRAINRFLSLRSSADCGGRTAHFFAAMLRIYLMLAGVLVALLIAAMLLFTPSVSLGFGAVPQFDLAFATMTLGMLLTIPANLATALYRARGHYGRAVHLQSGAMLIAQVAQLVTIVITANLLAVTLAYVTTLVLCSIYILVVAAPRLFPELTKASVTPSWRWVAGQFRSAMPFALSGATELALTNAPVLLVSAFVSDRIAVAQWGLTRVVAGLLRTLCTQVTLPLAAELGHDHAMGLKDQLQNLYARGSALVTLLASVVVSGLLAFWPDFFAIWTHGAIPYNPSLTVTLLVGTAIAAPSILALSYANYSDRGSLLASTKALQLVVFLALSFLLIPMFGPIGAALAIVSCDVAVQFGLLTIRILQQTLKRPFRHIVFLIAVIAVVTPAGWFLGTILRQTIPGTGLVHFVIECVVWLLVVALAAAPVWRTEIRDRLTAIVPR